MTEAPSITDLPEGGVTDILSITSPRAACRAASISKAFNSAAILMPSGTGFCHQITENSSREGSLRWFMSLKSNSTIDYRSRISSLIMVLWFAEVGILRNVWWLDIQGRIASAMLSPKTTYVAYLVYRITRDSWGLSAAGKTIVSFCGVRNEVHNVYLEQSAQTLLEFTLGQAHTPAMRNDGWMEIELGEFYCDNGDEGEVEMVFQEHDRNKGGLIVEGIELRPK